MVAFRGTEPTKLKDLLTDVELTMVPGPLGKVHEGFWESLEGIWDKLERAVASRQDGKRAALVHRPQLGRRTRTACGRPADSIGPSGPRYV